MNLVLMMGIAITLQDAEFWMVGVPCGDHVHARLVLVTKLGKFPMGQPIKVSREWMEGK